MEAKDPQAFFSLATAYAKPNGEQAAAYGRQLADIVSSTKAEFTKAVEMRVAEVQEKMVNPDYKASSNASALFQNPLMMMQSMVDNANKSYEQFFKAARHSAGDQEASAANLSSQGAEKKSARTARQ